MRYAYVIDESTKDGLLKAGATFVGKRTTVQNKAVWILDCQNVERQCFCNIDKSQVLLSDELRLSFETGR